jgi:hypothetical protein
MAILLALLLLQADEASAAAERLDAAIRGIAGYNAALEAKTVGDAAFLKRLSKDLVDAAPTDEELKAFVADPDPAKRSKAIDRLVADPRFDAFWARRFSREFFGDPAKLAWTQLTDKPPGTEKLAVDRFEQWLAGRFQVNAPWTDIVSQILVARGALKDDPSMAYLLSFWRGEGPELEFAQAASRHFLGIRLYCAKCHDHPYDTWRTQDFYGMAAFAVRQRAELRNGAIGIRYADEGSLKEPSFGGRKDAEVKMASGAPATPRFLFGGDAAKAEDPMIVLAKLMTRRENAQLPRALVNRIWGWLLGAGVVNPVDDFTIRNKPASQPLLENLVRDTIDHQYSLKRLVRVVCGTRAYQMATPEEEPEATSFRHLIRARLATGRYYPLPSKPLQPPLALDVPSAWTRMREQSGVKLLYVVRAKARASETAELTLYEGRKDRGWQEIRIEQFAKPKKTSESFDGKGRVMLDELSGMNTCIRGRDGVTDYVVLSAVLEFPSGLFTVRFEGPAAVVNDWRAEFRALLESAEPR